MKKGMIALQGSWIIDLFFLAVILLIFLGANAKIQNQESYNLKLFVRDYAYTKDVASLSEGNLNFIYKKDVNSIIEEKDCEILAKQKEKLFSEKYFCSRKFTNLDIEKKESEIIIKNE